jgi:myo-inositol 2-dehydrogenase / D-chiro-inositol 1-dehydrogenase
MTIRIGLVGAGFIAGRHVDSLSAIDGVSVVGVADPQQDRAARLAARAGARAHPDWAELLARTPARMVLGAWLDRAPGAQWWARQEGSGGQTVEQATHPFDVAKVLVGEVTGGCAVGSRSPDGPGDILDVCTAALRFDSGAVGSFANSCLLPRGLRIGIELVAPGLGLWLTEHQLVITDRDGARTVPRRVDPIAAEDRAFVAAVRGEGDDVRAPYAEALATHRLVTAVAAAAAGDGVVDLPTASLAR